MEEIIDQLDEKGTLIGTVDKKIAHRDGLWHRAVHVWVINDNNEILLQQRCSDKDLYPNFWDCSFAGHIVAGESSIIGAIREGKEELGIDVDTTKMELLFINKEQITYGNIKSNEFVDVYLLRQNIKVEDIIIQKEEVAGVKYISLEEFFKLICEKDGKLIPHNIEYQKLKEIL